MFEEIQPFFLSFLIGLLIGIERERSQVQGVKAIGIRTFILFALLGTLAARIQQPLLTLALVLFIFGALLLSYMRATQISKTGNIGITTEMAAASVLMLGYMMIQHRLLSLCIGTAVLLILYGRRSLHQFAKASITPREIEAAITILIISVGIVSFLPDRTIDPWKLFNPQSFGLIVLILAGLQFGGYIVIRLFGETLGMMLMGFLGGFVSSTAVFASLSHAKKKKSGTVYSTVVAGIFATIATLIAFIIVLIVAAPELLQYIIWPLAAAIALGGISSYWFMKTNGRENVSITYPNPLDIKAVLKIAVLIMAILIFVALTKQYFGVRALPVTAFITGLFEIHGMAYAIALLYKDQSLSLPIATHLLAIVVFASFVSKFALVWIIAHNRFAVIITAYLMAMLIVASGVYFLYLP